MKYEIVFGHGAQAIIGESTVEFSVQDEVLVQSDKGRLIGKIKAVVGADKQAIAKIVRLVSQEDRDIADRRKQEALADKRVIKGLVQALNLDMKVITVHYSLDRKQLFISFTADKRVDFRELLKQLAQTFKTRIELRQVGSRDAAKLLGGIGPCGNPLCCTSFIDNFPAISIKMAKNQFLSLNNNKLSGLCGRYMCCLSYEDAFYKEAKHKFPDYGSRVRLAEGQEEGQVVGLNVLKKTVSVRLVEGVRELPVDDIEIVR